MLENKSVMAMNIKQRLIENEISRQQLAKAIGVPYSTVSEWINAKKYPRIDKIELMANFFGCEKSDLIELKAKKTTETDGLSSAKAEMIKMISAMPDEQVRKALRLLQAFAEEE